MGYARSKWVAENIVIAAAKSTGMEARVLRSGQIIGDSVKGIWNSTEAIPLMFRAAHTFGALPALNETPWWLPVDVCADAVIELGGLAPAGNQTVAYFQPPDEAEVVYHVQNPTAVNWTDQVLPALAEAGLNFEIVSQREWVKRLRESEPDPKLNPTIKLLDFFTEKYDNNRPGRGGLLFDTKRTEQKSQAMRKGYDVVASGLLKRCVDSWRKDWA